MKKFKNNLITLLNLFDTKEELIDFLVKKNAFNEQFVKRIIETKDPQYLKDNDLTIDEIKTNFQYEVSYDDDKILVDITKNDVFSYLDTENELRRKMKVYIKTEQYEKAQTLKNYFDTIDLIY